LLGKYTPVLHGILNSPLPLEEKIKLYVEEYINILLENPKLTYFVLSVLHRNPDKITKMKIFQSLYHTGDFSRQFAEEISKGNIKNVDFTQFYLNMLSMITFPFTVKQVIMDKNKMTDKDFRNFMDDRKKIITETLIQTLK
jgi:TetR/AcrR family transcriptional regulator